MPAGVKGTFSDRASKGKRTRSALFAYTGAAGALAAQFEQALKDKGLSPEVAKTTVGEIQVIAIKAENASLEAKAIISTAGSGTSQVTLVWREAAP